MSNAFSENEWSRRPAGVGGGQFLSHQRTEPEVLLAVSSVNEKLRQRRAWLQEQGFAPAATIVDGANPYREVAARSWWGLTRAIAEDLPAGYPTMPSAHAGTSAYRKVYAGNETTVRMPSAASVRRFADQVGTTFDVPVEATTPNGSVIGHVRVTANGAGRFSVSAVNMPESTGAYVAESVSAVLEARRPTRALGEMRALLERRRQRIAAAGVQMHPLEDSSWIREVGYNAANEQMVIRLGERTYGYHVTRDIYDAVRTAPSPGSAYNHLVKKTAERYPIDECGACGRFYNTEAGHRCASRHNPPMTREERALLLAV